MFIVHARGRHRYSSTPRLSFGKICSEKTKGELLNGEILLLRFCFCRTNGVSVRPNRDSLASQMHNKSGNLGL